MSCAISRLKTKQEQNRNKITEAKHSVKDKQNTARWEQGPVQRA